MNEPGGNVQRITVDLDGRSYPVLIGSGLLDQIGAICQAQGLGPRALVIAGEAVGELYGGVVLKSLHCHGYQVHYATVPDGEEQKKLDSAASLYDACLDAGLDRTSFIVALGGGVIGDLAGFVAATYMRGIDFVQVPTTLLAQVDASVGGKTAVNHPRGKNLIGAFHQPKLVLADVGTLISLDRRQFTSGLAEVVKHGLIVDPDLFGYCEKKWLALSQRKREALIHVIQRSVEIKASVVAADERESNLRAILNFGHTVGHAIESASQYRYTHGEAISIGMAVEARLSAELTGFPKEHIGRIDGLLKKLSLPVRHGGLEFDDVWERMINDKKASGGRIKFALLKEVGKAILTDQVPQESVAQAFEQCREGSL